MLTISATTQLKACAHYLRMTALSFGSHPLAPAALFVAKLVLVVAIGYLVWTDLKWF